MFKKLFSRLAADKPPPVTDKVLGDLRLSESGKWWEGSIMVGAESVGFKIGGTRGPDPALIEHAREIVQSFAAFETIVCGFLEREIIQVKYLSRFADEIRQLKIQDVCLFWPKRPHDGMIYFAGPDKYRIWRCDYVNRKPKGLGFDD